MENQPNQDQQNDAAPPSNEDSLESKTTVVESDSSQPAAAGTTPAEESKDGKKKEKKKKIKTGNRFIDRFNIYLLLFVFVIIIVGVVAGISVLRSNQESLKGVEKIKTEPLSQEALDQLRQTDVKVGDPKQILSVESNAIFAGKVLIRDSLEVAGEIKAGAPMTLPGLTVTGNTTLAQLQAKDLQLTGNASIQGQVAIQNNLAVTGSGSFGGTLSAASLNIQSLQINGDVQFTKHIDAGGGTPSQSNGPALGGGGTASVSGTDTAGTVAINTGGGTAPGCFVTVNFTQRFNGTPHVVITPVGAGGASINYYINRSATNFSICTANAAPAGQSFAFDYVAID